MTLAVLKHSKHQTLYNNRDFKKFSNDILRTDIEENIDTSPEDIFQNGRMHICNHCNAFNRQAHLKKFKLSRFLLINVLRKRL